MKRNKFFRVGICIFATILTSSCNTSEARPQPFVEPYVPPVTDVSPTNTPLPPLPDFEQVMMFGGGGAGGDDESCIQEVSQWFRNPAVCGKTIPKYWINHAEAARWVSLEIFDIPADTMLHLSLTSPDRSDTLTAGLSLSYTTSSVIWFEVSSEPIARTLVDRSDSGYSFDILWPGGLPDGIWQVQLSWDGGMVQGTLDAINKNVPELAYILPNAGKVMPFFACRTVALTSSITIFGQGFVPDSEAEILIYEMTQWMSDSPLVIQQPVAVAHTGNFVTTIQWQFQAGKQYVLWGYDRGVSLYTTLDCLEFE